MHQVRQWVVGSPTSIPFVQASKLAKASYQEIPGVPMPGRTILGGVEVVVRKR